MVKRRGLVALVMSNPFAGVPCAKLRRAERMVTQILSYQKDLTRILREEAQPKLN
jgi:hypothetical protein